MSDRLDDDLQFDEAEFDGEGGAPANACTSCERELSSHYFTANDQVVCEQCRDELGVVGTHGSPLGRFAKATALGLLGGAIGAAIYFAIVKLTGYEIGLVAIVVGLLVGGGVRLGANGRGGWLYQSLAIVLTYCAVVVTYVPFIVAEFDAESSRPSLSEEEKASVPKVTITADKSILLNGNTATLQQLEAELRRASEAGGEAWYHRVNMAVEPPGETADQVAEIFLRSGVPMTAFKDPAFQEREPWSESVARSEPISKLGSGLLVFVIAMMAPFLTLPGNLIGLLIIGIALYEAWKINKRVKIEFQGPFRISELAGHGEASPAAEGG